jgi:RNA polymerase-associated protein
MMTLYSGTVDPYSHRCRIVLFEKGMDFQVIDVDLANKPEDLAVINPYNSVPVLVERELVLQQANIINEYIDELFPHPQLMPADPVMRSKARLGVFEMERECCLLGFQWLNSLADRSNFPFCDQHPTSYFLQD